MEKKIKKLIFTKEEPTRLLEDNRILNFLNMESIWHYKNNTSYFKLISQKHNTNFPDGRLISLKLGIKQQRGTTFTRSFLISNKNKKHFFIGDVNIKKISEIMPIKEKQLKRYNPPYIKNSEFSFKEENKIIVMLKNIKPDYIWICVGAPKQEILANRLFKSYPSNYFNVGAALDFLTGEKAEAPKIWRKFGIEWIYRGVTDFRHSRKKIVRSLKSLKYL